MNPRDAFFGGRTEAFKLCCSDCSISYEDVTSLYPWVNFVKEYPIGHPIVINCEFDDLENYFGIVKCSVLPPRDLYLPVLPMHCGPNKKLVFPLCQKCAENFQVEVCEHSEKERIMTGTWFSEELKLAVKKGYKIVKMHTVWHFEQRSDQLFREYVKTFYKKKLLSSKLPFTDTDEILNYIDKVREKEGIDIENVDDFSENPGLRQLTKLMLNNLWGRFGMRENLSKSKFVSKFEDLKKTLDDDSVEVEGVRITTDSTVQVIYKMKSNEFLPLSVDTNIFVALTTTAWARIRLYQEMDVLKERLLYCDTDSVIYKRSMTDAENLKIGPYLGEMTNELDVGDSIVNFVSGGPKNYAYRTAKGKVVVKVKGFTLNAVNSCAFSFDNVKQVILGGVRNCEDVELSGEILRRKKIVPSKTRSLMGLTLKEEFLSSHKSFGDEMSAIAGPSGISVYNPRRIFRSRDWKMLKKPEQKLYMFCFDKRIVLSNLDTVPFGYVGHVG